MPQTHRKPMWGTGALPWAPAVGLAGCLPAAPAPPGKGWSQEPALGSAGPFWRGRWRGRRGQRSAVGRRQREGGGWGPSAPRASGTRPSLWVGRCPGTDIRISGGGQGKGTCNSFPPSAGQPQPHCPRRGALQGGASHLHPVSLQVIPAPHAASLSLCLSSSILQRVTPQSPISSFALALSLPSNQKKAVSDLGRHFPTQG